MKSRGLQFTGEDTEARVIREELGGTRGLVWKPDPE